MESGKREATLLYGGRTIEGRGFYVEPTIFVDPAPNARVLKEEIFGPVLVIATFNTDDEVLEKANDTEYGLGAFLWTNDTKRSLRFSRSLEAGSVGVNSIHWGVRTPFGGWKRKYISLHVCLVF